MPNCPQPSIGKPKAVDYKFHEPNFCLFPNGTLPDEAREKLAEEEEEAMGLGKGKSTSSNGDDEPVNMGSSAKADPMDVDENE